MSYGLDNYVNNRVSDPVLLIFFLTVLHLDIKKRRMWFPKVFISALGKIGMDVKPNRPIFNLFSPSYGIRL